MNVKQSLRLAVLLVPVLATWAFAGIYYEQEMQGGAQTAKMASYISGAKMRVEILGEGANAISIQRYDQGKIYQLAPQNKMYMEMPVTKLGSQIEDQLQVTVTKSDETKKIGNYNCTRYDLTVKGVPGMPADGVTTQYWVTTDVDVLDEYTKFSDTQGHSESAKLGDAMAKIKGFPIQIERTTPMGKVTMTVTTVKKQDVPDSMFEVPADYQKMTMPTPGATPPAAPPAPAGGGAEKAQ